MNSSIQLYHLLSLEPSKYYRWCRKNILFDDLYHSGCQTVYSLFDGGRFRREDELLDFDISIELVIKILQNSNIERNKKQELILMYKEINYLNIQ